MHYEVIVKASLDIYEGIVRRWQSFLSSNKIVHEYEMILWDVFIIVSLHHILMSHVTDIDIHVG